MIKKIDIGTIFVNIINNSFFRNTLIISLIVSVVFPLFGIFFVLPSFTNQLITNIEADALRTATHLSSSFFNEHKLQTDTFNLEEISKEMETIKNDFQLEKIKVFSRSGEIAFSTKHSDIGKVNTKDYFYTIVAKGEIFSKVVKKNTKTLEDRTVEADVVEVYIPIMQGNNFIGAFEIYYDVTKRKEILDSLLFISSIIVITTSLTLLSFVVLMLLKASKADMKRQRAENDLNDVNENLEERVSEQSTEIRLTQQTSIEALAAIAEYYDQGTGAHLERIQRYVRVLASDLMDHPRYLEYLQSKPDYIKEIALASVLHDIGKTAIPKEILMKPGKLTEDEFDLVKKHSEIAGDILDRANRIFVEQFQKDSYLALAKDIAMFHHERWDGKGYPLGLAGEDIPLSARIVAVADVYDALRSKRPYKEPWPHDKAVNEIVKGKGHQFDSVIVDVFLVNSEQFKAISSMSPDASNIYASIASTFDEDMLSTGTEKINLSNNANI